MVRNSCHWTARKLSHKSNAKKAIQDSQTNLYHQESKNNFVSKFNINVPEDERKLYEQLTLQNHDLFRKSKDDLG